MDLVGSMAKGVIPCEWVLIDTRVAELKNGIIGRVIGVFPTEEDAEHVAMELGLVLWMLARQPVVKVIGYG